MPRTILSTAAAAALAGPAGAHVGHLGQAAGHDHWVAGTAIGAAVAAGLWAAWKGRQAGAGTEPKDDAAPDDDGPGQEAEA